MEKFPLGLNLGLANDLFFKSPEETLKTISHIGYKGIEVAEKIPMEIRNFNSLMKDLDLSITSVHANHDNIANNMETLIDYCKSIGSQFVILPWIPMSEYQTADKYKSLAEVLNKSGEKALSSGIRLCYHHHYWEFVKFDDKCGMDILLEETDKDIIHLELDTYWLAYVGEKPEEYIRKHEKRCPLVHLKDMAGDENKSFTEIGTGIIDFKTINKILNPGYVKWIIVEQDKTVLTPLKSNRISYENLKASGIA